MISRCVWYRHVITMYPGPSITQGRTTCGIQLPSFPFKNGIRSDHCPRHGTLVSHGTMVRQGTVVRSLPQTSHFKWSLKFSADWVPTILPIQPWPALQNWNIRDPVVKGCPYSCLGLALHNTQSSWLIIPLQSLTARKLLQEGFVDKVWSW